MTVREMLPLPLVLFALGVLLILCGVHWGTL
jgi:hypothetical protein